MKLKCPISLLLYVAKRPFSLYFQWKYFLFKREKEREAEFLPGQHSPVYNYWNALEIFVRVSVWKMVKTHSGAVV